MLESTVNPPRVTRSVVSAVGTPQLRGRSSELVKWLRSQPVSVTRHAAGIRPFVAGEFGSDAAAPSSGHIHAANELITRLRTGLLRLAGDVERSSRTAQGTPSPAALGKFLDQKERAQGWVKAVEKVWDFYFELFGQRQTRFGKWLLACDRIALDCYQDAFLNLGKAKSIPAPPPFSYMKTGISPATFRRAIPLRKLGSQLNPFPLIQLPYHRLMNPWTLGAILHEVSHNLHNDLGLDRIIAQKLATELARAGFPAECVKTYTRWNREIFADLTGLLLGGPSVVGSLMDVVGRSRPQVLAWMDGAVHPTPWVRTLISCELLRRMGFDELARDYRRAWLALYPDPRRGSLPPWLLGTLDPAIRAVVDIICFQPYAQLGGKTLAQVIRFSPKEQAIVEEAAGRLAAGTDPGVVPERFLIGASRVALERNLARPGTISTNFYAQLARS